MSAARTPEEVLRDAIAHACDLWQQGWDGGPDDVAEDVAEDLRAAGLLVTPEHDREVAAGALDGIAAEITTHVEVAKLFDGDVARGLSRGAELAARAADRARRGEG